MPLHKMFVPVKFSNLMMLAKFFFSQIVTEYHIESVPDFWKTAMRQEINKQEWGETFVLNGYKFYSHIMSQLNLGHDILSWYLQVT